MTKGRLEAFSDGVIAILITIMVLELHAPHGDGPTDLVPLVPKFLAYVLSFAYLGVYWNNHHHMLHTVTRVNGRVLWANLQLLFWLSLVPFVTSWMGEHPAAPFPNAMYGAVMVLAGASYQYLQSTLIHLHGPQSTLAEAVGSDWKGKISVASYVAAIGLSFVWTPVAQLLYAFVAILWIVPDSRIESRLNRSPESS